MKKSTLQMNNEEALFALLAETVASEEGRGATVREQVSSLLGDSFDWDRFFNLATYHGYYAASYRFFTDLNLFGKLPDRIRSVFESEYLLAQARFAKKESELLEIVAALEERDIIPLVFKGIPQAYLIYKDPGIRVSKDIDILVQPSQVDAAKQVLIDRGFAVYSGLGTEQDFRDHHFHLIFTRGRRMDVVVELHWSLLDPKKGHAMSAKALWDDTVDAAIGGRKIKTLRIPHVLWNMGVHLSYQAYLDFRSLVEIKRLALKMDEDAWDYVLRWATDSGTLDQFMTALYISELLAGNYLPPEIKLRHETSGFFRHFIKSTFYPRGLVWNYAPFPDTHELIIALYLRNGFGNKVRFLHSIIFPNRGAIMEIHPGRLNKKGSSLGNFFKGCYVFLKVVILGFSLGFMIRSGILGEQALEPTRRISV